MNSGFSKHFAHLALAAGLLMGTVAHANLVTNGSFSNTDPNGACTGWAGTTSNTCLAEAVGLPSGGALSGFIMEPGSLSQTLVTQAGHTYDLTFRLYNDAGPTSGFTWSAGGAAVAADLSGLNVDDFTLFHATFTATGVSTALSFEFAASQSFWVIDDVAVNDTTVIGQIPEPGSVLLFGLALAALGAARRRATKQ